MDYDYDADAGNGTRATRSRHKQGAAAWRIGKQTGRRNVRAGGAAMIIHMEQFGLKQGAGGDATLAVHLALKMCRDAGQAATLLFPKGTYFFKPGDMVEKQLYITNHDQGGTRRVAFPLVGVKGLTIDGQGSEFIFHGPVIPFVLEHTEGVTMRNLTIDWDRPMFEQGIVVESGAYSFVVQLAEGVPYEAADGRIFFHFGGEWLPVWGMHDMDPVTNAHTFQSGDRLSWSAFKTLRVEEAGLGRVRVCGELQHVPEVGHVIAMRFGRRENPGIFINGGRDVSIEQVTVHHAPGMGLVAQRCTNIRLLGFDVRVRPESGRVVTATADATHFTNCRGTIVMEHCLFENQLDDPCNVHGIYARIIRRLSEDSILVQLMHEMQIGVEVAEAGDDLQFVNADSLLGYETATVREAEALNAHYTVIRFANPLPDAVRVDDVVENLSWNADLIVRHCTVRANRARGFLITTQGRVLLEHNHISAPGAGIKISGDANSWYESGAVSDVTIRSNTFAACNYCFPDWGRAVIDIDPEIERPESHDTPYHRNIRIEDNDFETFDHGIVYGHSVDGFVFRNNRVRRTNAYPRHYGMKHALELTAVLRADIGGNVCPPDNDQGILNGENISLL